MPDVKIIPATEVACPFCGAGIGDLCKTANGRERDQYETHVARWHARRYAYRQPRRYELKEDDAQFGLAKGDILICVPYWLDPGDKGSVLYREFDGFDPQCNQYWHSLKPIYGPAGVVGQLPAGVRA